MNLSSAWIALALSLSLAASLLGNAWQWRHSGIAVTRAEGVTDRCTDANAAAAAASTAQSEALWKCVGEDQIAEVTAANSAAHAARDAALSSLASERALRNKERSDANHLPGCADFNAVPVCPGISRLFTESRHAAADR